MDNALTFVLHAKVGQTLQAYRFDVSLSRGLASKKKAMNGIERP